MGQVEGWEIQFFFEKTNSNALRQNIKRLTMTGSGTPTLEFWPWIFHQ